MRRKALRRTSRSGSRSSGAGEPVRTDLFIGNAWHPAASGKRYGVINPATEECLAEVAEGDAADIDRAVQSARTCFDSKDWQGRFPLNLASWKVAPALAAGCTVVLKPAHETPLTALLLGDLVVEAGLPPGALNVVPGMGTAAGAALVRHPEVDKIAFTGSTEVGQWIMREAAGTLKRGTLELGGKSPNVIFADADLAAAVGGRQTGIVYGEGEVCAAGRRRLVEK